MKKALSLILLLALVGALGAGAVAQEANDVEGGEATVSVADLRSKLLEVQSKEAELQARAKQLDEDLKPENIARSLAGVGSTKPEEIRELRRRELTIEKESVAKQLQLLATSRTRLENVIRSAEIREYQQTADGSLNQVRTSQNPRWIALMMVAALAVLGAVLSLVIIRKRALS